MFANKNFDFIGKAHTCFANYIHKYKQDAKLGTQKWFRKNKNLW